MISARLFAAVLGFATLVSTDHEPELATIRDAYQANRDAHSRAGTIRFHSFCRNTEPSSLEGLDAMMRDTGNRPSPSSGVSFFDGTRRRFDNLQSLRQLVACRFKDSPTAGMIQIWSGRLLTDGQCTLVDITYADPADRTIIHSSELRLGTKDYSSCYLQANGLPLNIGNPNPCRDDLDRCLTDVLEKRDGAVLAEYDDSARLDGAAVVKLTVAYPEKPERQTVTFWVDREHGAVPLRTRHIEFVPHTGATVFIQLNNNAIKRTDRGWLPFHSALAEGEFSPSGGVARTTIREVAIDEADFAAPPDRSVFALEFPEDVNLGIRDDEKRLGLGKRRVWTLEDFSPAARAKGEVGPLHGIPSSETSPWRWPRALTPPPWLLLLVMILACGLLVLRRPLPAD